MSQTLIIKTKNINNQRLYLEINDFIESGFDGIGATLYSVENRETFVEVIEEWLEEFKQDNYITQYNIICDDRNNLTTQNKRGYCNMMITYKQTHCLNVTSIEYTLTPSDDVKDEIITV